MGIEDEGGIVKGIKDYNMNKDKVIGIISNLVVSKIKPSPFLLIEYHPIPIEENG